MTPSLIPINTYIQSPRLQSTGMIKRTALRRGPLLFSKIDAGASNSLLDQTVLPHQSEDGLRQDFL